MICFDFLLSQYVNICPDLTVTVLILKRRLAQSKPVCDLSKKVQKPLSGIFRDLWWKCDYLIISCKKRFVELICSWLRFGLLSPFSPLFGPKPQDCTVLDSTVLCRVHCTVLYLYCDKRRDIQWNIAWAGGKSQGRSRRDFPRALAIFHRISWLES